MFFTGQWCPFKNIFNNYITVNQKIQVYWSKLRQDGMDWWKSFFQDMGLYNPSDQVQVECLRYYFTNTIRKELSTMANEWNQKFISESMNGRPSGCLETAFF